MSSPRLPEVERVVDSLAEKIRDEEPSSASLWQVQGAPTAGKSATLHALAERLSCAGLCPVLVAPPMRALDAGLAALVQVGASLKAQGVVNGELSKLQEPTRPFAEKVRLVVEWVEQQCERVVLLCDEPLGWASTAPEDVHFSWRTRSVQTALLEAKCRRVVAGNVPEGLKPLVQEKLERRSDPRAVWLNDPNAWGMLATTAAALQTEYGAELGRFSPLEIRLLVALKALAPASEVRDVLRHPESRRRLSARVAMHIGQRPELRSLCAIWAKLELVRLPFGEDVLGLLGATKLDALASDLLRHCLLYVEANQFVLHDTLRADARGHRDWLSDGVRTRTHAALAEHYRNRFESTSPAEDATRDARVTLPSSVEALHHATEAGDPGLFERLQPWFVDQLNTLGRVLSRDQRRYADAVKVFERAVQWDDTDDYAHHYLAFNLDVQGIEPERVEQHYKRSLELKPLRVFSQSRWICFLITRARIQEARKAWDDALDALSLPNTNTDPSVYEHLHLWVARLLLHRSELEFAREVLRGIPLEVRSQNVSVGALERRLRALLEASERGAFVPGPHLRAEWWKDGPFLLSHKLKSGAERVEWIAARVETIEDKVLHLRVARVNGSKEPQIGTLEMPFKRFDEWSIDEKASEMSRGRFLEIGKYVRAKRAYHEIRVHPQKPWSDDELPALFPRPDRYAKRELA